MHLGLMLLLIQKPLKGEQWYLRFPVFWEHWHGHHEEACVLRPPGPYPGQVRLLMPKDPGLHFPQEAQRTVPSD